MNEIDIDQLTSDGIAKQHLLILRLLSSRLILKQSFLNLRKSNYTYSQEYH
jgi:hypothetical protein